MLFLFSVVVVVSVADTFFSLAPPIKRFKELYFSYILIYCYNWSTCVFFQHELDILKHIHYSKIKKIKENKRSGSSFSFRMLLQLLLTLLFFPFSANIIGYCNYLRFSISIFNCRTFNCVLSSLLFA